MVEAAAVIGVVIAAWAIGYRDGLRVGRLEGILEAPIPTPEDSDGR